MKVGNSRTRLFIKHGENELVLERRRCVLAPREKISRRFARGDTLVFSTCMAWTRIQSVLLLLSHAGAWGRLVEQAISRNVLNFFGARSTSLRAWRGRRNHK